MDSQDQRRAHTQGHENHGVHLCYKCGWPFPNPHPSAKHRRAHKRICGTIEGYRLLDSEKSSHLNGSDDERLSDDEHKLPSPKVLEKSINEKGSSGKMGDKVDRSEDEMFSDAVAEFSESRISPGIEERFHDSSESAINVEMVGSKDPKISEPSEDNKGLNAADVSVLTVKPSDDCQMQTPQDLQREGAEEGNTQELQGQPLGCTTDLLGALVSDLKTEESTVVHSNSCPSKAEATSDVSPENNIHAGENVIDCGLTPHEQETTTWKGKGEIKSDRGMVGIVVSTYDIVDEVCEVSEPKVEVRQIVTSDHKTVDGAVELKEEDGTKCSSVQSQDDLPHEVNSSAIVNASSNGIQVDAMPVLQFVTSSDPVKTLEEKGGGNVNVDTLSTNDGIPDVSHPQSEFEDHEGMVLQNPMLHSSEALKHDEYDLKEDVTAEKHFHFNSIQLSEEYDNLSPNMLDVESSIKQKLDDCEPLAQEMLAEEPAEVSLVKLPVDGSQRSDETGASVDAVKSETYESHMIHSFGEQDSDDVCKSSQQMNLLESRNMVSTDEFEDFKDQALILDNPSSLHSSEALRQEEDDLKDPVTKDNLSNFNSNQLNEETEVLSPGMLVLDDTMKKQQVNGELMVEEMLVHRKDSFPVKLTVDDNQSSEEIGAPVDTMKCELNQSHMVYFSGEQESDDVCRNSQQIDLPEDSVVASFNKNPGDTPIDSTTSQTSTITVISKDDIIHQEKHRTEIDDVVLNGNSREANKENAVQFGVDPSRDSLEDKGSEVSKLEKRDITNNQCREGPVVTDISSPKAANNSFESPITSEGPMNVSARKSTDIESTNINAQSGSKGDIKEDEIINNSEVQEKCVGIVGTVAGLQQSGDSEQLLKPPRDHYKKDPSLSPSKAENSAHFASAVEDNGAGEPVGESSEITTVPVQGQNSNIMVQQQLGLSGIDASVDTSSRCDSLEGNWGSVSVVSLQSDVPAVVDAEALSSTDLLPPTEAEKSTTNSKAAIERQQYEKSEMFEPPSFMTLVEPGHSVGPNAASSEVQKGQNPQQPNSTSSQAGWFPTLSQVVHESQGRKKNEEVIAKVTNWSISKQHTPLKSLMVEASPSNKPKSSKYEENAVSQKNGKVPKDNTSGLTTVNSILGPESPADQVLKAEAAKEWNSPARYPAELKREKRKTKSRPYWIQFVCCSSVDPQRS
ncbi:hypothetical protein L6164_025274 [Bauhinia variegata]|uniref:Uncharacterized protein n=1 Tax=Bauhinia variegata TaxID=167791 RepID=A0ACB9M367_BAUVA|nr:hypothetical protein L6164_025274 [Bauhinia variegata]